MENEIKENEKTCKCNCPKVIAIIAIVVSILSIIVSVVAITLTLNGSPRKRFSHHREEGNNQVRCEMDDENCGMRRGCQMKGDNCPMQKDSCPMQDRKRFSQNWQSNYCPKFDRPAFESNGPSKTPSQKQPQDQNKTSEQRGFNLEGFEKYQSN